jgi:DNA repair exonuclease SbcCD ATPase subunit
MKAVDWAFLVVFITNFLSMAGGLYLLLKISDTAEMTKSDLLKSIGYNADSVGTLKAAAQTFIDQADHPTEKASVRAIADLNLKIENLVDLVSNLEIKPAEVEPAADPEVAQKLREKLKDVLTKNSQLQTELDQVKYRLKKATAANNDVKDGFSAVRGVDPEFVKMMVGRTTALEEDLRAASERAESAESIASKQSSELEELRERADNALSIAEKQKREMEELRERATKNDFVKAAAESLAMKNLQEAKDEMEKTLKKEKEIMQSTLISRIQHLETELERATTEKQFIEDNYLALLEQQSGTS